MVRQRLCSSAWYSSCSSASTRLPSSVQVAVIQVRSSKASGSGLKAESSTTVQSSFKLSKSRPRKARLR